MNLKLFQVFYDNEQPLDRGCLSVDARGMDVAPLYENKHILNVYEILNGANYYGLTSWRMAEKTNLTKDSIDKYIAEHKGYNVYIYGQYGNKFNLVHNQAYASAIGICWKRLFQLGVFKTKQPEQEWVNVFCNYWIADKKTWDRYIPYLKKTIQFFNEDHVLKWLEDHVPFPHRNEPYPIEVFVLEYLFGLFLIDNPDISWKFIPNKLGSSDESHEGLKSMNMKSLTEIYQKYKSPVLGGGDKGTMHNYIENYEKLFKPLRNREITFLEIGVDQGHSLKMWREYFPNARIIGIDIKNPTMDVSGCEFYICDQSSKEHIDKILGIPFDVIIDDGSHVLQHQMLSHLYLFPKLKKGGMYIIEDIQQPDLDIPLMQQVFGPCEVIDTRKKTGQWDDILMIWRK